MVLFFPVLGWQEAEQELRTAGTGGAVPWERELRQESISITHPGKVLFFWAFLAWKNWGFSTVLSRRAQEFLVSPELCVRCRKRIPTRPGLFFWDQRHPVLPQNLPCRVMTRSGLFLKLLLLSSLVCLFGNEERQSHIIHPKAGQERGSAAPSPSFPRIKHCSGP